MPSLSRYYKVKLIDTHIIINARHPKAKQVIWGWGGGSAPGGMELYGNSVDPWQGDWTAWRWDLSPVAVQHLRACLLLELAEPVRYESGVFEQRRCRELLALLDHTSPK